MVNYGASITWTSVTSKGADTTGTNDSTTAILAGITSATAAGGVLYFPAGTYIVSGEIAFTCSFIMDPGATIKAAPGYSGVLASTPKGTRVNKLIFTGGAFDGNGTASNAFWAHQMTNCIWNGAPFFQNAVQDDLVIGDPTDTGPSFGNHFFNLSFYRGAFTNGSGYANLLVTSVATDNHFYSAQGGIREIGINCIGGDNKFITPHFSNGNITCFLDGAGANNAWVAAIPDTPGTVAHAGATATNGVSTITDASIAAAHAGLPVTGTNIPAGTFVGTVTAGTSFTIVNSAGGAVTTTGNVSGITLVGVGFNLQGATAKQLVSPTCINSSVGLNATCYAVCIGPSVPRVTIGDGINVTGQSGSFQWLQSFTGNLPNLSYQGLWENNVSTVSGVPVQIANEQIQMLSAPYTLANNTNVQPLLNATAAGALTVLAGTTYEFECVMSISGLSSSSHTIGFGLALGGGASVTSALYQAIVASGAATTNATTGVSTVATAAVTVLSAATTNTNFQAFIRGVVRVNAGGTITPQIQQNTASAAGTVATDTFFRIWAIGSGTVTSIGPWS